MGLIKPFRDFTVRGKLNTMTAITVFGIILFASGINLIFKASKALTLIVNIEREHNLAFYEDVHFAHNYLITGNRDDYNAAIDVLARVNRNAYLVSRLDSIRKSGTQNEFNRFLLNTFPGPLNQSKRNARILGNQLSLLMFFGIDEFALYQNFGYKSYVSGKRFIELLEEHYLNPRDDIHYRFNELLAEMNVHFENFNSLINRFVDINIRTFNYAVTFLLLLIASVTGLLSFFILRSFTKPIRILNTALKSLSRGNLQKGFRFDRGDELGELARNMKSLRSSLQEVVAYSEKIAGGDYTSMFTPRSDEDELAVALNQMATELQDAKNQRERNEWLNKGVMSIGAHLQGELSVRQLSEKILDFYHTYLHVEMGAVYAFDEVLGHLQLTGSFGLKTDELQEFYKVGEGLIGKVASKGELFILDTPGKHHHIYTATGEYFPDKVYIIPLTYNYKLRGVVELASVNPLDDLNIEFLKSTADWAATHMRAAISRYRLEELVKTSNKQSAELEAQKSQLQNSLSEIHHVQKKLEWEKLLLDTLLDNLPDSIYFKDSGSRFLRASRSMVKKWNFGNAEELIGKSDFDLFPEDVARPKFETEQEILATGKPVIGLVESDKHPDGSITHISTTKMPFVDKQGTLIGTFGISRDITALKTLEMEIMQRNIELEGQKEKMRLANEELQTQQEELRVANEELANQTKTLIESEKMLQVQQEELTVTNEELAQRTRELELQRNNIIEKNEELLRIQNQLEIKAKELEANSRYKSEFLANMSHELRTPLNSLLVLSKLLSNNKTGNLTPDQLKSIGIIYKSGSDLLQLINEILDLSKIEAGKVSLEYTSFETIHFIEEIIQGFLPLAREKKIDFKHHILDEFPDYLYADRIRLMQILRNLLSNAFKFTSKGSVTLSLKKVVVNGSDSLQKTAEYLVFSVKDTGIGIPDNKKEAIFEAFQQADGTISRKFGGTGLGLSISRELANMMKGKITVDSIEGLGSEFAFWLPADKGDQAIGDNNKKKSELRYSADIDDMDSDEGVPFFVEDDRNAVEVGKPWVLIIHDNQAEAMKLTEKCHTKAFKVVVARNIADGILLSENYKPGAVLLSNTKQNQSDIRLLKGHKNLANTPVHLISPFDDDDLSKLDGLNPGSIETIDRISNLSEKNLTGGYHNMLVVEDDPGMREAINKLFEHSGVIIDEAATGTEAYEKITSGKYDCIILDLGLPDFSGNELLERLEKNQIQIPHVIVHTARELSMNEIKELRKYSGSIVIKGLKSDERLMDEVELFLHRLSSEMPVSQKSAEIAENIGESVFKGRKVLIVDDDIRNIYALAQVIEEHGMTVFEAENGVEALEVLQENPGIDLVLMDVMMPEMNGYEAIAKIRKTPGISKIPIIVITAKAMKDDYHEALNQGANDYLSKPVDDVRLINLMKIWLTK